MNLTTDGRSAYVILVGPHPSIYAKTGAEDLQKYTAKISGARLPIVQTRPAGRPAILLGTDRTLELIGALVQRGELTLHGLGEEGYAIETCGQDLIIAANTPGGAMFGVYGFLEEVLGCRFFMPDEEIGEHVPRRRTIKLPDLGIRSVPSMEFRSVYHGDWARKNRLNIHSLLFELKPDSSDGM